MTSPRNKIIALAKRPIFSEADASGFCFQGFVGDRIRADLENWLLPAPKSNPAMLQMFRDRDRKPRRKLCPWAGEFAGKYLTSAVLAIRTTGDERLGKLADEFARDLIDSQDADGYLGPYQREERFFGKPKDGLHDHGSLWDVWGHYHCMLGLLLWYYESGYKPALDACVKAADLICRTFLDRDVPISANTTEDNGALHIFPLLYEETGENRYLQMAQRVVKDWERPGGIDYLRDALAGKAFYEFKWPRWEGLHAVQGLVELYFITGDEKYRKAAENVWISAIHSDRHNTGAFSSNEGAVGNPYDLRAIETCCTVAWIALSIDMLRLTGNPLVADEMELATFNAMLGAQAPSGRWWTYNTPMDGERQAFVQTVRSQLQVGGHELGCCTVNGPRSLGMIGQWAVMTNESGVVLNYYGPCEASLQLPEGGKLSLKQNTEYPMGGDLSIQIGLDKPSKFKLHLRVPGWSEHTAIAVNGEPVREVKPGTYCALDREWQPGDAITLTFDMSLHFWVGERDVDGKISMYRGPILLAYDQRCNTMDPDDVPSLNVGNLDYEFVRWEKWPKPWMLLRFKSSDGRNLFLCDFASAGGVGTQYRSWLPFRGITKREFFHPKPLFSDPMCGKEE